MKQEVQEQKGGEGEIQFREKVKYGCNFQESERGFVDKWAMFD